MGEPVPPFSLRHLRRPLPAATRSGRFFFCPVFRRVWSRACDTIPAHGEVAEWLKAAPC